MHLGYDEKYNYKVSLKAPINSQKVIYEYNKINPTNGLITFTSLGFI